MTYNDLANRLGEFTKQWTLEVSEYMTIKKIPGGKRKLFHIFLQKKNGKLSYGYKKGTKEFTDGNLLPFDKILYANPYTKGNFTDFQKEKIYEFDLTNELRGKVQANYLAFSQEEKTFLIEKLKDKIAELKEGNYRKNLRVIRSMKDVLKAVEISRIEKK